jgi:hypothetical protein
MTYTFEHLIDAQMEVRKMLIESGIDIDVANDIFIHNISEGCKNLSRFNQENNDSSSEEAWPTT